MGFNTTVVVLNDALHEIEKDLTFGKKLVDAIRCRERGVLYRQVSSNGHCGVATVIEEHHADEMIAVAVGGNTGLVLGHCGSYATSMEQMLKNLATEMGYRLVKRRKP